MGLAPREREGDSSACAVGDHAGLDFIAATRAAKRFALTPLRRRGVFLAAPVAFLWIRTEMPSKKAMRTSPP